MKVTDETLEDEDHNTIELVMPDAELFDHLAIDQQDRYPSGEAYLEYEGHNPYDRDRDRDDFDPDDYQDPPMPDEYDKCDNCGATDNGSIGQRVTPRGTALLTAPRRAEYLCPECFAQVASQYIGLDPYPALVAVLLSEHAPVWKIAQYHGKGIDGAEEIEAITIDLLAEWKTAYDAAETVDLKTIEAPDCTDRERRFLEIFPSLGVGQPGIEFESDGTPDISVSDIF